MAWKNPRFPKTIIRELSQESKDDPYIQIYPFGTWPHPIWGDCEFNKDHAERMKQNFENDVLGHKLTFDYEHKMSTAHGTKAAGTLEELQIRDDGMYGLVNWTPQARKEIEDGEWLYFSPTYADVFERGSEKVEDVLLGGGLTNSPVAFGIAPVNCSTIAAMVPESEFADWEHSEPGTGNPPEPGKTGDVEPAPFYDPPDPEDKVDEKEIRALLGLDDSADIAEAVKSLTADATAYKEATAVSMSNVPKEFLERLERVENENRENAAKAFAATYVAAGIPPVMQEQIETAHKAMSAVGGATHLAAVLDAMPKIKYDSESGTTHAVPPADGEIPKGEAARKAFGAIQSQIATEQKIDMRKAFSLAAQQNPELFAEVEKARTGVK